MKINFANIAFSAAFSFIPLSSFGQTPVTVANPDTILTTATRNPISINNLLSNDTDEQGDPLTILNVGTPQFGKTELKSGNIVVYTPGRLFAGTDSFTYRINDRPNGFGNSSTGTVSIRNPFLLGRGTYATSFSGVSGAHDVSGYFNTKVAPNGEFTTGFRFSGKSYRFKGRFDLSGNFSGEIARGKLPPVQISLLYAVNGNTRQISGTVTFAAETIQFTAPLINWSRTVLAPSSGRYTVVLPAPNRISTTPQGYGFATLNISRGGSVTVSGRTGDNRSFSSSSVLSNNGTSVPVYGSLSSVGSIYGTLNIGGVGPKVAVARFTVSGNLRWFTPKTSRRSLFPNGFDLTVAARGSGYIEPVSGATILTTGSISGLNSNFTASAGDLRTPRTERASIGRRPLAGTYELGFDNSKRFAAHLAIVTRNGAFTGSFYDTSSKNRRTFKGVFIQGENKAYGLWRSSIKTGKVELSPDTQSGS